MLFKSVASHVLSKVICSILGQAVDHPEVLDPRGAAIHLSDSDEVSGKSFSEDSHQQQGAQYVPGGMVRKAREHPQVSGAHRGPGRYLGNTSSHLF